MGTLVFQAALGGTVNLVGPNTAATTNFTLPAADGSSGQALTTNGSGTLAFGTLGVSAGGTGVTSTPSNGQLLIGNGTGFTAATLTQGNNITITNSSGGITISAPGAGNFGTDLTYIDYSLTTSTALSADSAGIAMQSVSLDGTSELMILSSTASAHAVVWNSSTNTFGTPVLVRTANFGTNTQTIALTKVSATSVLMCSLAASTTALETVVLTISGSTITVNTAVATTLAASSTFIAANTRLVTVGSSYVLNYTAASLPKFRAITVSGTTPSIGSELAYAGGTPASSHSYAYSSTILLHLSSNSTSALVYAYPISVSGTTLTGGTQATIATNNSNICSGVLSTGRVALTYANSGGAIVGALVSVSGSTATITAAATTMSSSSYTPQMQVFSNQAFILTDRSTTGQLSVLTDTAGAATVGTPITLGIAGNIVGYLSTSKILIRPTSTQAGSYYQYGISSGAAVLEKAFDSVTSTATTTLTATYQFPLSGPPQSGSNQTIALRTSAGKVCIANSSLPFSLSIDGTSFGKIQQTANPFNAYNDAIDTAIAWGIPGTQSGTSTAITMRKVTLA